MIGNLKALPIGYAVNVELDVEQKGGGDGDTSDMYSSSALDTVFWGTVYSS